MSAELQSPPAAPAEPSAAGPPHRESACAGLVERLLRYRDIVFYRTLAGLKTDSRQFYLGYVWFVLEPVINTTIMYVIFRNILGRENYALFLLLGTLPWQWFEGAVHAGMGGIKGKLHIMAHFNLPKAIFPLVGVFINTWKFLCVFAVLLGVACLFGRWPNAHYVFLPVVLAVQLCFIIGLALPLAVAVVYLSDISYVVSTVFRIAFFVSGIFFSVAAVPPALAPWFYANPMAVIIESYRRIVLDGAPPDWGLLSYALAVGLALCAGGFALCRRIDQTILKNVSA